MLESKTMFKELESSLSRRLAARVARRSDSLGRFDNLAPAQNFSAEDLERFRDARGPKNPPAIILHGVTTRSGTVHATELLRLHPQTCAFPRDIWEFPLLQSLDHLLPAQQQFFRTYRENEGKLDNLIYLPLLGAATIRYLYSFVPAGKTLLLKVPNVAYLDYFPHVFPFEHCVVLMRDGRDVVQSTISTWKDRKFEDVSRDWNIRARFLLGLRSQQQSGSQFHFARYEDVQADPAQFVRQIFAHAGLDTVDYPFGSIETIPVRGSSSASVGADQKVTWAPVDKPKDFKTGGRWKDEWSDTKKNAFKRIAGQTTIDWGYAPDMNW